MNAEAGVGGVHVRTGVAGRSVTYRRVRFLFFGGVAWILSISSSVWLAARSAATWRAPP